MSEAWWYLSRSSGIVATALIVASLLSGWLFSAHTTGERRKPAWWLDLHNYLGGLTLVFTVIHLVAVYMDEKSGMGLVEITLPWTAEFLRWGIAWGVIATYLLLFVVLTSWPARRGTYRTWKRVHLLSIGVAILAGVHAWMTGSSRTATWLQVLLVMFIGLATYPGILRLWTISGSRRGRGVGPPRQSTGSGVA